MSRALSGLACTSGMSNRPREVVALLKRLRPGLIIILGGPEVSYETEGQAIVVLADHVITGEGRPQVLRKCAACSLIAQRHPINPQSENPQSEIAKLLPAELPPLHLLASPYELYNR